MSENRTKAGRGQPKVVIYTSDRATRVGTRLALEADGIRVCAGLAAVDELIVAVERHRPDACLIDVDGKDGLGVARVIAAKPEAGAVILLTEETHQAERFLDAMRLGANGYVYKGIGPDRLPHVVRAVIDGEPAIPRALVVALLNEYRERPLNRNLSVPNGRSVTLTAREWEVLDALRDGFSTRDIAKRLFISEVTVRRHIGAIVKKLRVDSRAAALELLKTA